MRRLVHGHGYFSLRARDGKRAAERGKRSAQFLRGEGFCYDLWVSDGLPVRCYEWAETVERLRVSGQTVQVRFG